MINNLLCETCSILHCQENSRDSFNEYDYWEEPNIPCLGVNEFEKMRVDTGGYIVVRNLALYLVSEITAKDKIVYDDYEYSIVPSDIQINKDMVSGNVEFYIVNLERRKAFPPETVEIKRR